MLELHRDVLDGGETLQISDVNRIFRLSNQPELKKAKGFFRFTIVRNPYARLVSAYLDKCVEFRYDEHERHSHAALIGSVQRPISEFLGRPIDHSVGYSFADFVDYLLDAKKRKYAGVDMHFWPQLTTDRSRMNATYRVEDDLSYLEAIYDEIFAADQQRRTHARQLVRAIGPQVLNPTVNDPEHRRQHEGFVGRHNFAELMALRSDDVKFDYGSFYDGDIAEKVSDLVSKELTLYGYDFPFS